MRIWLRKSASIRKRTSPLKFDNFAEKSGKDTVSYLSSKAAHGYPPFQTAGKGERAVSESSSITEYNAQMKDTIPYLFPIFQQNYQTLQGSFSSVSKPIFATKYAFFSILRDLQDLHTFAPLRTQNLRKNSSNCFRIFARICAKILIFLQFSSNFAPILMIFFGISPNILENVEKS